MITERELRQMAGREQLGVGQAEHEYALLCVLDTLARALPLSDALCLKGGTALRLVYFADWRRSVDLDFSTLPGYVPDQLREHVAGWLAQVGAIHGVAVRLVDFHRVNGAARMRAQFVGPLSHPARLLFDVTMDEPVLLPPTRREVSASRFPGLRPSVLTYQLEEILAEKMRSILERGKSRDYYDVWRLLGEKSSAFDRAKTRSLLEQKCRHRGLVQPIAQEFLAPERLTEAGIFWERDLATQITPTPLPSWPHVTAELEGLLRAFFGR